MTVDTVIALAAEAIITTRDCCGDELRAATEEMREHGVNPNAERVSAAFAQANGEWDRARHDAGVTAPVGQSERAQIHRDLS